MYKSLLFIFLSFLIFQNSYSGEEWDIKAEALNGELWDIQFVGNKGWAVGTTANIVNSPSYILYTSDKGENWQKQKTNTNVRLKSVFFFNSEDGWAVGKSSTIIHTTNGGKDWITESTKGILDYNSIFFVDENTGWIVGNSPDEPINILLKTTDKGKNWIQQNVDFPCWCIGKIFFVNPTYGWITGGNPTSIIRTTNGGYSWEFINMNIPEPIFAIYFVNKNIGWACGGSYERNIGSSSVILKTTDGGINWINQYSGSPYYFTDIHFIDENHGWSIAEAPAVGCGVFSNIISYTHDGGRTWKEEVTNTKLALESIYIDDNLNAWVVGFSNWSKSAILHAVLDTTEVTSAEVLYNNFCCNITINPNPVSNYLKVLSDNNPDIIFHNDIFIYDIYGRLVLTVKKDDASSSHLIIETKSKKIDISRLFSGIYFLKIGSNIVKFLKIE